MDFHKLFSTSTRDRQLEIWSTSRIDCLKKIQNVENLDCVCLQTMGLLT